MQNNRFVVFLIILLLSVIPILKLPMEGIISPVDTEFPTIPEHAFSQSLYRWSEFNNGYPNIVALVHDIPTYGFTLLFEKLGVELWVINRLWFIIPLFLLGISGYYFSKSFLGEKSIYPSLITSFLLIYSIPTASSLLVGWPVKNIIPLAFSIFLMSFFINGFKNNYSKKYLIYGGFSSVFAIMLPNLFGITLFILLLYLFVFSKYCLRSYIYYIKFLLIILLINMSFFLPFLIIKLSGFQYYHVDPILSVNAVSIFNNAFRTLTLRNMIPPVPLNSLMLTDGRFLVSFFIVIIAFIPLLFKKYTREVLFLSLSTIFLLILAGGNTQPFGQIYMFLFQNIPMFEIFRETSKLNGFLMLNYAVLFSISTLIIKEKLHHILHVHKRTAVVLGAIIILSIGFYNSYPLYTGDLNDGFKAYDTPQEYFEYNEYIEQKNNPNILILPMPRWFSNFNWHNDPNHIVNIIRSTSPSPIIYAEINQHDLNPIQLELYQSFLNETKDPNETLILMNLFSIQYILVQEDQLNEISGNIPSEVAINLINDKIDKAEYLYAEKQFGNLKLFAVNKSFYVPPIMSYISQSNTPNLDTYSNTLRSDRYKSGESVSIVLNQNQNKIIPKINTYTSPRISFQKINPTKYKVKIENAHEPFYLILSESFHSGWKAYINSDTMECNPIITYKNGTITECKYESDFFEIKDLTRIFSDSIPEDYHFTANGYANGWYVDSQELGTDDNFTLTLYFNYQFYFYIGIIISVLTFIVCMFYLVKDFGKTYISGAIEDD